jgi:hypothetical protein
MLDSITKFGGATEKFSNISGVLSAAKSAVLNKHEDIPEKVSEIDSVFSRPKSRRSLNLSEVKITEPATDDETAKFGTSADEVFFDEDIDDLPMFKSERTQDDLLSEWEVQAEDNHHLLADEAMDAETPNMPPLLLGFDTQNYFVELEYMVVADPETGESVAPEVSVKPSQDNKSGEIYLNGKLVACVEGAQDLLAQDVVLIKVAA